MQAQSGTTHACATRNTQQWPSRSWHPVSYSTCNSFTHRKLIENSCPSTASAHGALSFCCAKPTFNGFPYLSRRIDALDAGPAGN